MNPSRPFDRCAVALFCSDKASTTSRLLGNGASYHTDFASWHVKRILDPSCRTRAQTTTTSQVPGMALFRVWSSQLALNRRVESVQGVFHCASSEYNLCCNFDLFELYHIFLVHTLCSFLDLLHCMVVGPSGILGMAGIVCVHHYGLRDVI